MCIAMGLEEFNFDIILLVFFKIVISKKGTVGLFFPVIDDEFVIDV